MNAKIKSCFFISCLLIFINISSFGLAEDQTSADRVDAKILPLLGNVVGDPLAIKEIQVKGENILVLASSVVTKIPPKVGRRNQKSQMKCDINFYFYNHESENKYSEIQNIRVSGDNLVGKGKGHSVHDWIETADLKGDGQNQIIVRINTASTMNNFYIFDFNKNTNQFVSYSLRNASIENLNGDNKSQIVTVDPASEPRIYELKDSGLSYVSSNFPDYYKKLIPLYLKVNRSDSLLACYKLARMQAEYMNLATAKKKEADDEVIRAKGKPIADYFKKKSDYWKNQMDSY